MSLLTILSRFHSTKPVTNIKEKTSHSNVSFLKYHITWIHFTWKAQATMIHNMKYSNYFVIDKVDAISYRNVTSYHFEFRASMRAFPTCLCESYLLSSHCQYFSRCFQFCADILFIFVRKTVICKDGQWVRLEFECEDFSWEMLGFAVIWRLKFHTGWHR